MFDLKAEVVPWSSVVGTGLMLLEKDGRCVGQLALFNVQVDQSELKDASLAIVNAIAEAINARGEGGGG